MFLFELVSTFRYECDHCDFGTVSQRALEEHVDDKHPFLEADALADSSLKSDVEERQSSVVLVQQEVGAQHQQQAVVVEDRQS